MAAAAKRWGVPADACGCTGGKITHVSTGKVLSFGSLVTEAAAISLDKEPDIKTPDQYTLVGKWTPRLDTAPKLDGSAQFGIDAKVPGMVYAAVWSAPVYGGSLKAVDESGLSGLRGIVGVVLAIVEVEEAVVGRPAEGVGMGRQGVREPCDRGARSDGPRRLDVRAAEEDHVPVCRQAPHEDWELLAERRIESDVVLQDQQAR